MCPVPVRIQILLSAVPCSPSGYLPHASCAVANTQRFTDCGTVNSVTHMKFFDCAPWLQLVSQT